MTAGAEPEPASAPSGAQVALPLECSRLITLAQVEATIGRALAVGRPAVPA